MVGNVQLVALDVAIAHGHNLGIALNLELQLFLTAVDSAPLAVDGMDAYMLQVTTIGLPRSVVGNGNKARGFARGFYLVAGHLMPVVVGNGLYPTRLIGYILPANLISTFGIGSGILLSADALPIYAQFHLIGIGIGDEGELAPRLAVPVVAHTIVACLHPVPHLVALAINNSNMHQRLFGFKETLHEIGFGLGLKGYVEHSLRPSLVGPALTLT